MFSAPHVGESARSQHRVTHADTAHSMGNAGVASLGSPRLLHWVEMTTSMLWESHRDEAEGLLGLHFDFHHLAASPLGAMVTVQVTVEEVDRRRASYRFEAWDEAGPIGRGTSETFLMPLAKLQQRLTSRSRASTADR